MARKIGLFYRKFMGDYVVNSKGKHVYEKGCEVFSGCEEAIKYIVGEYGKKNSLVILDRECWENRDGLVKRLEGTKIRISNFFKD